ncbi:hypothetical protein [Polaribacter filamentus]|uniref:hypothetical protein n=1 Tax=Polaribacter filamentus TaxID=53483 RepID=UPI001F0C03C9|nr:hypothetical protein [Polaribacter filamentus]
MVLKNFYKETTDLDDKEMLFSKFEIVIDRLNETLNELIETVKIQENRDIVHDDVSFDAVFTKTLAILDIQILDSKAVVTSNFSEAPTIKYPKLYMESILLNLLSNSIRYRAPDRIAQIHFRTEIINNEILLIATDNGLGIDLKNMGINFLDLIKHFIDTPILKELVFL